MEWIKIEDQEPKVGDQIIARLWGNKMFRLCMMTIREGEGLGHIESWKPFECDMEEEDGMD